jgi:signal transduction histidine kinase
MLVDVPPEQPRVAASAAVAWSVAVGALALIVVGLVLRARNSELVGAPEDLHLADLWLAVLGPVVGASLLTQDRRSLPGLILLATAVMSVGWTAGEYATYATTTAQGLPGDAVAAWVAQWTWVPYLALPMLLALTYPDERVPRPRWLAAAVVADLAAIVVLSAVHPGTFPTLPRVENPLGLDGVRWLEPALTVAVGVAAVGLIPACFVAAAVRWRRSSGDRRTQLGWFVAGIVAFLVAFLVPFHQTQPWSDLLAAAGYTLLFAGIAIGTQIVTLTGRLRREREELVRGREEERLRLHRDLHDGLGPELAGVALQIGALSCTAEDPATKQRLTVLQQRLQVAVGEVRRVVDDLRPAAVDTLGLVPALREWTGTLSTPELTCGVEAGPLPDLPPAVEMAAYRITTEAVTNAVRHGRTGRCEVRLSVDPGGALVVEVSDDGIGVPSDVHPGVGLPSMRARAGDIGGALDIAPRAGGGTVVRAVLPVTP